ncbi:histone-lysine N-methyltransferase SETDB1-B-like [Clytia hemisphaerica]|uniref:Histone-lysine N-methyltransferase SETDB1 n=1 Tax=Clytia hemisphaerica TaxID=252671 RepID=A0A7M6DJF1_9CNID
MIPMDNENAFFENKVKEIINQELVKAKFDDLCKTISTKIIERVHKIDDDHQEINQQYDELGEMIEGLLANNPELKDVVSKSKDSVIVIDDDEEDENLKENTKTNYKNGETTNCKNTLVKEISKSISLSISKETNTTAKSYSTVLNSSRKLEDVISKLTSRVENSSSITDRVSTDDSQPDETTDQSSQEECYDPITISESNDLPSIVTTTTLTSQNINSILNSPSKTDNETSVENEDSEIEIGKTKNIDLPASLLQTLQKVEDSGTNEPLVVQESPVKTNSSVDEQPTKTFKENHNLLIKSKKEKNSGTLSDNDKTNLLTYTSETNTNKRDKIVSLNIVSSSKDQYNLKVEPSVTPGRSSPRSPRTKSVKNKLELSIDTDTFIPTIPLPPRRHEFAFEYEKLVFAKPGKSDIWYQAKLMKELGAKGPSAKYSIQFISGQKLRQKVDSKSIATRQHCHPSDVVLGTRIVAGRPSDTVNSTVQKKYKDITTTTSYTVMFAGTIAELACEANRYRYLVFFDDGYAQYLPLNRIFPVVHSSKNVWEDVSPDCQEFIKEYLQEYPMRPLVVTQLGYEMQTEWNGEWWQSKVVSIDSSLVKILFDVDKRSEWIYRGTTRLEPLYNHFINPPAAESKASKGKKGRKKGAKETLVSYVDEKITDPQYGVCNHSLTDPRGEKQFAEWGEPRDFTDKILARCYNEEGVSLSLTSPRVSSPPPAPPVDHKMLKIVTQSTEGAQNATRGHLKLKLKRSSSNDLFKASKSSSPSNSPRCRKKVKAESPDDYADNNLPFDGQMQLSPSPEKSKEEISQEELLGALSALNTSPNVLSPKTKGESSATPETTKATPRGGRSPRRSATKPSPQTPNFPKPTRHSCNENCITDRRNILDYHRFGFTNYLSIPFHLGWKRESAKKSSSYHRDIYYRTPCNKRVRNLAEITKYLLMTNCTNVCIDMFCFYSKISCRSQPVKAKTPKVKIDDLSDGRETCPVVLINDINEDLPPHLAYISSRNKAEDVYINIDPGFLVCCDCTDFCQDKSKCRCAQLTVESSNAIDGVVDPNAGYHYRRLKECITTGIYECNSNCSCKKSCYNRVVQNGIQLRLQVFMTENRGWGLRCMDDVAKGTFICTYAGQVLNEQTANREGMDYGDEYLAELDHIEVAERAKDGYESDVPELKEKSFEDSDNESSIYTESESSDSVINISSDSDGDSSDESDGEVGIIEPLPKKLRSATSTDAQTSTEKIKDTSKDEKQSQSADTAINKKTTEKPQGEDPKSSEFQNDKTKTSDSSETKKSKTTVDEPMEQTNKNCENLTTADKKSETLESGKPEVMASSATAPAALPQGKKARLAKKSTGQFACKGTNNGIIIGQKKTKDKVKEGKEPETGETKTSNDTNDTSTAKKDKVIPTRSLFNKDDQMYVIDAKSFGNVGRFMNHSCSPNLFVQNVMVDTHDLRFPWVAFFAGQNIPAYTELTWDYSYEIGSVPGKELYCKCGSKDCKGRLL